MAERGVCPICSNSYLEKTVGCVPSCGHRFCLECILEWGQCNNLCPVDKVKFNSVTMWFENKDLGVVNIMYKKKNDPELSDVSTHCEECAGQRMSRILQCDACDLGYHLECLKPPLTRVPRGPWYCPVCYPSFHSTDDSSKAAKYCRLVKNKAKEGEQIGKHRDATELHASKPNNSKSESALDGVVVHFLESESCGSNSEVVAREENNVKEQKKEIKQPSKRKKLNSSERKQKNTYIEKPFECDKCFKHFATLAYLYFHGQCHETKKFKCHQCHKSFTQKSNLQVHFNTRHLRIKPFTCSFCKKAFAQKGNMLTHIRNKHTRDDQKPYRKYGRKKTRKSIF